MACLAERRRFEDCTVSTKTTLGIGGLGGWSGSQLLLRNKKGAASPTGAFGTSKRALTDGPEEERNAVCMASRLRRSAAIFQALMLSIPVSRVELLGGSL